ncbi:MAG: pantetheine-phosphate adenylyltransferase [SAR202 cluster bacterium]|jgi:pantetheine-phosphate adenylyltransferase|nr:pantetheine-phosphate adenylyltransferase [Chloroflexota bacterium]MCH2528244.1 pantetheine-phosphate adenylyltransferase [Dehalococcoidia bacterium]MQG07797.1 pantetheine-phosphate adenylyltransferase [SAR202 cluster bacterium]MQG17158.1 pantetheine-phosphate adenylyltransferase [SAR202 cluster bacterium]MQG36131.1 pantetheine-phosphate adenylyltransferase [SAR202 cluster bacterium]|tara:strand:- start:8711 stop:9187 length:477 start_codon:yes stop_codon:yes gene_type:complete
MVTALYPGTFDPITVGHLDIAERAAALFEKLIIGVYKLPDKNLLFSTDERVALFEEAVKDIPNVEVRVFDGLVVRFAKDIGASVIVRGLRSGTDFEYEFDMTFMNRRLEPDVDVVCLMTSQEYKMFSSSLLKEVARLGGDVQDMVPDGVVKALKNKFE